MDDFPAAHSMDTYWYAVDRDGHVAAFFTGETGPYPEDACIDSGLSTDQTMIERLARRPETTPRREALVERSSDGHRAAGGEGPRLTLLFVAADAPIVAELMATAGTRPIATLNAGEQALLVDGMAPALHERLHRDGLCLTCWGDYGDAHDHEAARLGLFVYDHSYGDYYRRFTPTHPLRVDALPAELRDELARVRYRKHSFAESEELTPFGSVRWWDGEDDFGEER